MKRSYSIFISSFVLCYILLMCMFFLKRENQTICAPFIHSIAKSIEKQLNISKFHTTFKDLANCELSDFPDIPNFDFSFSRAAVVYYDGSDVKFPLLVSLINALQRERIVVFTHAIGLKKCMLLGVWCIDMFLSFTPKDSLCLAKPIISEPNICFPCYLYFLLLKNVEILKLDLKIMCRKNVDVWAISKQLDPYKNFCRHKFIDNTQIVRIKNSKEATALLKSVCEISLKTGGVFSMREILFKVAEFPLKENACSDQIIDNYAEYKPNNIAPCFYMSNSNVTENIKILKKLGIWYGENKINPYHNTVQASLVYFLRLSYKEQLYPLDVRYTSDFHSDSHYGGKRGTSIGRYYLHKWLDEHITKYIKNNETYDCLEIGDGHFIDLFLHYNCKSKQAFDLNDKKATIRGNIENPDFHLHGKFNLVICAQVLEHVDFPEKAMHDLNLLLQKDGLLFLTVPFISPIHGYPHDITRFTSAGIKKLAEAANFKIKSINTLGNSLTSVGYMLEMSREDFWRYELDKKDNYQYFGVYAVLMKSN